MLPEASSQKRSSSLLTYIVFKWLIQCGADITLLVFFIIRTVDTPKFVPEGEIWGRHTIAYLWGWDMEGLFECKLWFIFCLSHCYDVCNIMLSWWGHQMKTFSELLAICVGNSPVPGEFPAQRPVTQSFDAFFDLRLNKWLSKQSWGWWFEMLSRPLWLHYNDTGPHYKAPDCMLFLFSWWDCHNSILRDGTACK